jgi:peptidoglycan-associated lipoprotein
MKLLKLSNLLALGLALSLAGAGCKHGHPGVTPLGHPGGTTGNTGLEGGGKVPSGEVPIGGGEAASFNPDDMAQDRTALAAQTIYFEYDSTAIKPLERVKLETVASALRNDSAAKLLVEGHCDERGTEEYNRSLGERRALAAREALAVMGIDAGRIATRSYGEDRPADPGHSESSWGRNRRDEFVLLHAK